MDRWYRKRPELEPEEYWNWDPDHRVTNWFTGVLFLVLLGLLLWGWLS